MTKMYYSPNYYPYWTYPQAYRSNSIYPVQYQPYWSNMGAHHPWVQRHEPAKSNDFGSKPFVVNIEDATKGNNYFRTAFWTGKHLQLTLMSIGVGEDIGLEIHPHLDQFIRIEEGQGLVQMGDSKDRLDFQQHVRDDFAVFVPAGKWHNLTNTGNKPLKLYSIYAPPEHPFGTVHETKAIAEASEHHHHH